LRSGASLRVLRASPDGRWVLVTSETGNSVAIIDAHTHALVHTVLVGTRPRESRLHTRQPQPATSRGKPMRRCIASRFRAVPPTTQLVQLRKEARPMGVALDAARGRLYVSTGRGGYRGG